jgi:hypothetical protein
MKFTIHPENNIANAQFHIKLSENKRWAIWIQPVMYGFRVQVGLWKDNGCFSFDYCGGAIESNISFLYSAIEKVLEGFDENSPVSVIENVFPHWNIRPIHNDKILIKQLEEMSGLTFGNDDLEDIPNLSLMRREMGLDIMKKMFNIP